MLSIQWLLDTMLINSVITSSCQSFSELNPNTWSQVKGEAEAEINQAEKAR